MKINISDPNKLVRKKLLKKSGLINLEKSILKDYNPHKFFNNERIFFLQNNEGQIITEMEDENSFKFSIAKEIDFIEPEDESETSPIINYSNLNGVLKSKLRRSILISDGWDYKATDVKNVDQFRNHDFTGLQTFEIKDFYEKFDQYWTQKKQMLAKQGRFQKKPKTTSTSFMDLTGDAIFILEITKQKSGEKSSFEDGVKSPSRRLTESDSVEKSSNIAIKRVKFLEKSRHQLIFQCYDNDILIEIDQENISKYRLFLLPEVLKRIPKLSYSVKIFGLDTPEQAR